MDSETCRLLLSGDIRLTLDSEEARATDNTSADLCHGSWQGTGHVGSKTDREELRRLLNPFSRFYQQAAILFDGACELEAPGWSRRIDFRRKELKKTCEVRALWIPARIQGKSQRSTPRSAAVGSVPYSNEISRNEIRRADELFSIIIEPDIAHNTGRAACFPGQHRPLQHPRHACGSPEDQRR